MTESDLAARAMEIWTADVERRRFELPSVGGTADTLVRPQRGRPALIFARSAAAPQRLGTSSAAWRVPPRSLSCPLPPKMVRLSRPPAGNSDHRNFTVRDLPAADRPRERMAALGAEALSQQELIACLLGRGVPGESVLVTAQRLLARFGSLYGIAQASLEELAQVRGIGLAKSVQLKAACELARRISANPAAASEPLRSAEDAIQVAVRHLAGRTKEHFILLLLDTRHRVMKVAPISVGSLDASLVHPREAFREAISAGAAAIILAHNHPSGDPAPSAEDLELTHRLIAAGRLMGIPVLDHVIIGHGNHLSLNAAGVWPHEDEEADADA